ncbi:glycosyltransferase [Solitalea sp. MAHUQ-68]|uniref:Glycosyltransferase n=1 Tax=Solitalea agri TaxID=2953739 RepID=A0A9X2F1H0_9SPHI|nr:glycosyltransferase [Solitalea agri]MCO4292934.1 glycosyltransferase [Solitalea agri]
MKVVHINSYDGSGGAARAAARLNEALKLQQVESEFIVNYKYGTDTSIKTFSEGKLARLYAFFLIGLEHVYTKLQIKKVKIPFSIPFIGKSIEKHPLIKAADILHLHWTNQGFLTISSLKKLLAMGKPVVWTFHDSYAFTGGCHVRYSCENYKAECGNCPVVKNPSPRDVSHQFWLKKKALYAEYQFQVITPSNWLGNAVKQSSLMNNFNVQVIPNAIDADLFKPTNKTEARNKLNLNSNRFIMLSGFMPSKVDMHKGTSYLLEALEMLASKVDLSQVELVIFGNKPDAEKPSFKIKTTYLGIINNDAELATIYSAAHVFLTTTLEDNLPNTVMESLSCGTPVISFTTGGVPDMVSHQQNGYLAQYKSSEDFCNGILWAFNHPNREVLNENARQTVEQKFSLTAVGHKHLELYKTLLQKS